MAAGRAGHGVSLLEKALDLAMQARDPPSPNQSKEIRSGECGVDGGGACGPRGVPPGKGPRSGNAGKRPPCPNILGCEEQCSPFLPRSSDLGSPVLPEVSDFSPGLKRLE